MEEDPWLTAAEVAELLGWKDARTWQNEVRKGRAPRADDPDDGRPAQYRMPRWKKSTVVLWRAGRAGKGRPPRKRIDGGEEVT